VKSRNKRVSTAAFAALVVQTLEKDLQLTGWWEFPLRAKLKGAIRDRLEALRRLGTKEEGGAAGSRND
jgi:hypothetical protein